MGEKKDIEGKYIVILVSIMLLFFGFVVYLVYDIINAFSNKDFFTEGVFKSIITTVITLFVAVWFSKMLDSHHKAKGDLKNLQKETALKIVDICGLTISNSENQHQYKEELISISRRAALILDDNVVAILNQFNKEPCDTIGDEIIKALKKKYF